MDRTAHRRVGAAAIVAFLLVLLIGASRGPAQASPATPAATPDSGSQVAPSPSDPYGAPGFRHDRDGNGGGFDGDRGGDGGGGFDDGGAAPATPPATPAPNSGAGTSTT